MSLHTTRHHQRTREHHTHTPIDFYSDDHRVEEAIRREEEKKELWWKKKKRKVIEKSNVFIRTKKVGSNVVSSVY